MLPTSTQYRRPFATRVSEPGYWSQWMMTQALATHAATATRQAVAENPDAFPDDLPVLGEEDEDEEDEEDHLPPPAPVAPPPPPPPPPTAPPPPPPPPPPRPATAQELLNAIQTNYAQLLRINQYTGQPTPRMILRMSTKGKAQTHHCSICHKHGHSRATCQQRSCTFCRKEGHLAYQCYDDAQSKASLQYQRKRARREARLDASRLRRWERRSASQSTATD